MPLTSTLIETHELAALSLNDILIIETDMTRDAFEAGHIPGSIFWPLHQLVDSNYRLKTDPEEFRELLSRSGITPDTLVVCSFGGSPYMAGWAPWLFWILTSFGHRNAVVLNGGSPKWRAEGRPMSQVEHEPTATHYPSVSNFDPTCRATLDQVRDRQTPSAILDARTLQEFDGEHYYNAPPKSGERAGRIPGAQHVPHSAFLNQDGTFLPVEDARQLVGDVAEADEIITYCAAGIRSALLWFVLKHRLNLPNVRNYDGSWMEWSRSEESGEAFPAANHDALAEPAVA